MALTRTEFVRKVEVGTLSLGLAFGPCAVAHERLAEPAREQPHTHIDLYGTQNFVGRAADIVESTGVGGPDHIRSAVSGRNYLRIDTGVFRWTND